MSSKDKAAVDVDLAHAIPRYKETAMHNSMLAIISIALFSFEASNFATAQEDKLEGTYRLVSTSQKVVETGQVDTYANERGFIMYGSDGRMSVIIVRGDRPKAESIAKITDPQRIELFNTYVAYGGTYRFDGKTVEHHIDIAWNEIWTGTKQVRTVTRDGDRITLTTPAIPRPQDGKLSVTTLEWEKVK
jgi:hypothetical protein